MSSDHSFLITPFDTIRPKLHKSESKLRRCLLLSFVFIVSSAAVAYSWFRNQNHEDREPASLSIKNDIIFLKSILHGSRPDDLARAKTQRASNKLKFLHSASRATAEIHGPFPRIGMYGIVPKSNADIVDDLEDPQVTDC